MPVINDISPEMVSISRMVDRLPSGNYLIEIEKPPAKGSAWKFRIEQKQKVREGQIDRREK